MKHRQRQGFAIALTAALAAGALQAQIVPNGSFEDGLTGWTVGGTGRVAVIQGSNITGTGANVEAPDGDFFAVLSTGPGNTGGGALRIDANNINEFDAATLSTTVTIPSGSAVLAFDWTFPTSEQDQAAEFDDLFDVMVFEGAPPADPTTDARVFARSSPRNSGTSVSNFPDAPILGTQQITWAITGPGSAPVTNTQLRFRVPAWRRACVALPLPADEPGPFVRTIRFRVADQSDATFDSALFIDNVQIQSRCADALASNLSQITETSGSQVEAKDGGLIFRPVQTRRVAMDTTGTVVAVASNANLDGTNPNLVEQVFIRVGGGGWQRVTGLPMQEDGEVQGLAFSGALTTGDPSEDVPGRYLAIAARLNDDANTEIYRWDRVAEVLTVVTNTSNCDNRNPSVNRQGTVIAFDSDCDALTSAGSNRHVVVWDGGPTNAVDNLSGTANCYARNPQVGHRDGPIADGRYVVWESNCDYGQNADGNQEIFRLRRDINALRQITVTTDPIVNFSPQIDHDTGRNLYFLSNGNLANQNPIGAVQAFRFQCNNLTCAGSTGGVSGFFQWTQEPVTNLTIGFRRVFPAAPGSLNERFVFERLDLTSPLSPTELVYRVGANGLTEQVLASMPSLLGLATGDASGVPVAAFLTDGDLINENADENLEAFSVRVE